jgi:hypothetical protein
MDIIATELQHSSTMLLEHGSVTVIQAFNLERVCLAPPFSEQVQKIEMDPLLHSINKLIIDLYKIAHTFSIQFKSGAAASFLMKLVMRELHARMNKAEEGEVCRMDGNSYQGPW